MRLLLIPLVAALALIVPSMSYSDTVQYEMNAIGFVIHNATIERIFIQTDSSQDKTVFEKVSILIGDKTHTIKNLVVTESQGKKLIKINGITNDNLSISVTGRLIAEINTGAVYETRGSISGPNVSEKVSLIITIKQKLPMVVQSVTTASTDLEPTKNLTLEVNQNLRNYWNENYKVAVKVFDNTLNKKPKFDDFFGTLNNVQVNVTMTHSDGKSIYRLNGFTKDNGFWQGTQYFPENISKPGKYNVLVVAKQGNSTTSKNLEMFLFGVVANRITVTNGTAQ